eukprot:6930648-Pyramimonas_sp.AAC.1
MPMRHLEAFVDSPGAADQRQRRCAQDHVARRYHQVHHHRVDRLLVEVDDRPELAIGAARDRRDNLALLLVASSRC